MSFFSFSGCFCQAKNSQQQYFQVKPQDVEVGQGGRVIISCQVGDRRGRVQWTKDGLTLGKFCLTSKFIRVSICPQCSFDNSIREFLSPFVLCCTFDGGREFIEKELCEQRRIWAKYIDSHFESPG